MGAGATSGLQAGISGASDEDLKAALAELTEDDRKKIAAAVKEAESKNAAPAGEAKAGGGKDFETLWPMYDEKMKKDGCNDAAIAAFKYTFGVLCSGKSTMIPEADLDAVAELPDYDKLDVAEDPALLKETVVLKLNGGLGTGMGLDKAKSLLSVVQGNTFLDLIAKQVDFMKKKYESPDLKFLLMNSFSTSADTKAFLEKYPELGKGDDLEFVQNKAPKVTATDYTPVSWPENADHEWCPPGHGDLYAAILGSGTLEKLLGAGMKYMFVSNSDNLGATMDLKILSHFVKTGAPFMMEVAARTDADKKGGHLGTLKATGGLTLRESAQCPKEDEKAFQDTSKYTYFNTNNLWIDLVKLKEIIDKSGGAIPLPVMLNDKTVDPRDKKSTKVIQLETAMGAAISCFEGATALQIPRTRFAPVKKCDDLIALRSDAYMVTDDFRIQLCAEREGVPPLVKLDDRYKFVDAMETLIPNGPPSLKDCKKLEVKGECEFAADVICKGEVCFNNAGEGKKTIAAGTYENQTVDL
eukprot:TRINITY_DN4729_c0_g1_i2.p1 TRINITY_DN4729_c0_g1~~TRINITY_DN4729_c0_g1_i2.p1  ORF type:complete len:526 (-),score=197.89 TRINITY_DN4729_c0_g1_i2:427-2004(-)